MLFQTSGLVKLAGRNPPPFFKGGSDLTMAGRSRFQILVPLWKRGI